MARKRRKTGKSVTQQIKSVNDRYKKTVGDIDERQERVVTAILIPIQSNAAFYTPQDTNALINSQYRRIVVNQNGLIIGRVGYTQDYALPLHERADWMPRPPNSPGKRGGGYNPNATHHFLERGARDSIDEIKTIIKSMNKL